LTAPPSRRPWYRRKRTWAAAVWLLLPVLYVLSMGPAAYVHSRTGWFPYWLFRLYAPLWGTTEGTSAASLLDSYEAWWITLAVEHEAASD